MHGIYSASVHILYTCNIKHRFTFTHTHTHMHTHTRIHAATDLSLPENCLHCKRLGRVVGQTNLLCALKTASNTLASVCVYQCVCVCVCVSVCLSVCLSHTRLMKQTTFHIFSMKLIPFDFLMEFLVSGSIPMIQKHPSLVKLLYFCNFAIYI